MKYVIIGNSAAGISATEAIRERDKESEVIIISDEPCHAYSRVFLANYIAGKAKFDNMLIRERTFYDNMGVKALLGQAVTEVMAKSSELRLLGGGRIPYDNLLIATGASPSLPNIPGIDKQGATGLRTFEDASRIVQLMKETNSAVIIGGGLVSLKAAEALAKGGVHVTIVISSGHVLSQRLDSAGASIIQKGMESKGIKLLLNSDVKEIRGITSLQEVELTSGERIKCGMVIVGKGVKPNIGLVAGIGIDINRGIKVDSYQQTNIANILAAGDVAESYDLIEREESLNAMWPNAVAQGRVAGTNMAGGHAKYEGGFALNSGAFFGIDFASVGRVRPRDDSYRELTFISEDDAYRKIVIHEGRIAGALLVGDISSIGVLHSLICQQKEVTDFLGSIEKRKFCFANVLVALIGR